MRQAGLTLPQPPAGRRGDNARMLESVNDRGDPGAFIRPAPLRASLLERLGPEFHVPVHASPLPVPHMVGHNRALAREMGLDEEWLRSHESIGVLTGNALWPGSRPVATVYSGHQFGQWAGQLGDGRALLLGETAGGLEIQLKGAGLTPFSRMGDGRAVLRSSIREFLCSEAMHGLGIPTTRALCVTGSDAPVRREELETAAVVTRVAPSFIRFGHFEHFSYSVGPESLRALADAVIGRFYPQCLAGAGQPGGVYAAFLQAVSERTAQMVAQWQAVGFCHGVMNTDNMSILGLTIDYGPFQFLDGFNPDHICNHSDTQGRYAYNRQPNVAYWNLFCLAQALLPLIGEQESALAALESYKTAFPQALMAAFRAKLGLKDALEPDRGLVDDLLQLLATERVDYTIFWRRLSRFVAGEAVDTVRDLFLNRPALDTWLLRYSERLTHANRASAADLMLKSNPQYVLRNHLGELAIRSAKLGDFSQVERLLHVLQAPFDEHAGQDDLAGFPPDWAQTIEISCSS